jgi:uncharacterized protein (TIGR02145 family)
MKRILLILTTALLAVNLLAQVPQGMSYQAIVRNTTGLVINTAVGMRISILQGSTTGSAVYVETQTPTTNANGLITLNIGSGTVVTGTFATINWSSGIYFVKTEIDPTGGTSYNISSTNQLLSVPYALYSKTAGALKVSVTGDTLYLSISQFVIIPGISLANKPIDTNIVTDYNGNNYNIVTIGTQSWMTTNLKVTKYSDGSIIPIVTKWDTLTSGAMCTYNNTSNLDTINSFGRLYNWYAVSSGKLCPKGWHVPNDVEWTILSNYLLTSVGGKLKEIGTTHWLTPNTGATNGTGFTALPGGLRSGNTFLGFGKWGYWWSSTICNSTSSNAWDLYSGDEGLYNNNCNDNKNDGYSVRCIKN